MNHRSVGVFIGYFGPIRVVYRSRPLNTLLPGVSSIRGLLCFGSKHTDGGVMGARYRHGQGALAAAPPDIASVTGKLSLSYARPTADG